MLWSHFIVHTTLNFCQQVTRASISLSSHQHHFLFGWAVCSAGWFDSHLNEREVVFHSVALIGGTILNDS